MIKKNIHYLILLKLLFILFCIYNDLIIDSGMDCSCSRQLPSLGKDFSDSLLAGVIPPDGSYVGRSYCNEYTDYLGSGQNVISYSYYTPARQSATFDTHWFRYLTFLDSLLQRMTEIYPGWRMRIYHNVTQGQRDQADYLCNLTCTYPHLDLCDVRTIPSLAAHQDLESAVAIGRAWRFVVLGDPTVQRFGVRDLDSYLLQRERDVVTHWMDRNEKQFYIMRDTPQKRNKAKYLMPMYGGIWGGNNYFNFTISRSLRIDHRATRFIMTEAVKRPYGDRYFSAFYDMVYLRHFVWPVIRNRSDIYDAYHCKNVEEMGVSQPFPTQREGHLYVGSGPIKYNMISKMNSKGCPKICRPVEHQNWTFC